MTPCGNEYDNNEVGLEPTFKFPDGTPVLGPAVFCDTTSTGAEDETAEIFVLTEVTDLLSSIAERSLRGSVTLLARGSGLKANRFLSFLSRLASGALAEFVFVASAEKLL